MALQAATDFASSTINPTLFQYNLTLHNTGTTTVGSLWFAWDDVPDQNFMPTSPGSIQSPAGWSASITHNGAADGFGIKWIADTPDARLAPGATLAGFDFQSATTPTAMAGKSPIDGGFDTTSSFVYSGAPFSDAGFIFTADIPAGGATGLHAATDFVATEVQPGLFEYSVTLHNTGTTTIGTLWFAWDDLPDQNFMAAPPVVPPAAPPGWTATVTHNPGSDGYGIEWVASTPASRLAAGATLSGFSFRSTLPPASFAGKSTIDPAFDTTSSFVYEGLPKADPGFLLSVACFAQGTRLRTPTGWRAVETLAIGDRVTLRDGSAAAVEWLGWRTVDCRRHPSPRSVWPIRIAAHAFAPGRPARALLLSPDHAVFAAGRLVPAHLLVNGATITREPVDAITYWHVELPAHGIVDAEGLAAESYLDTGNRAAFANAPDAVMLHPDFSPGIWARQGCAPLLQGGPVLARLRARLLARAQRLGHALTDDPGLGVLVDGAPARLYSATRRVIVQLPPGARELRLRSRCWVPAETTPAGRDPRRLGVAIARPRFDLRPAALDDPRLAGGWLPPEPALRWTDGDAVIRLDGARRFDFDMAMIGRYWKSAAGRMRVA